MHFRVNKKDTVASEHES